MSHSIPTRRTKAAAITLAALLAATPAFALPDNYIGADQGLWSDPNNWSAGVPNNSTFDVTINNAAPITVQLDASETINTLSLAAPDALAILAAKTLTLAGNSLVNTGTINLAGSLSFLANATLSGMGTMLLNNATLTGASGVRLLTDNLISGSGNLGNNLLKFTNTGTINASTGTLTISPLSAADSFINQGLLEANGGKLILSNGTYNNSAGLIEAQANSIVAFGNNTAITGGTIRALAGGSLVLTGSMANAIIQADPSGLLSVNNCLLTSDTINGNANVSLLIVQNSLTINGLLTATAANSVVTILTPFALNGAGTLSLSGNGATISGQVFSNNSNIQSSGKLTISNFSVNTGTITSTAGTTTLQGAGLTNSGTLQAIGGNLTIKENLDGGTINASNGGAVFSVLSNINNALLTSSNGGSISLGSVSNSTISGYNFLSNVGGMGGTINNLGIISVIGGSGSFDSIAVPCSFIGGGTLILNPGTNFLASPQFSPLKFINSNLIIGQGRIGAADIRIANSGTISAFGGTLLIDVSAIGTFDELTNTGILRADAGGTLVLTGAMCPNMGGIIEAINGGTTIIRVPINGGILRNDTNSSLIVPPLVVTPGTLSNFINQDQLVFSDNEALPGYPGATYSGPVPVFFPILNGTISNVGVMSMVHTQGAPITVEFYIATLTGQGTLTLSTVGSATSSLLGTGFTDCQFTSDNTINGSGFIGGYRSSVTNTGSVIANASPGITIVPYGTSGFLSTGLLRADGAPLTFADSIAFAANTFSGFSGTALISGTLEAINNGTIVLASTAGNISITSPINLTNGHLLVTGHANIAAVTGTGDVTITPSNPTGLALVSDGLTVTSLALNANALHTIRAGDGDVGTSKLSNLSIASTPNGTTSTYTSTLDLNDNKLILQSDPTIPNDKTTKLISLQAALASGYHNGDWLGTGITSSTVAIDNSATGSHITGLALYDNADLGLTTFGGQSVDTSSILITTAVIGDTNDDGIVDIVDLSNVAAHWQTVQHSWSSGDVNGDGFVDILDFSDVAAHWQQTLPPPTLQSLLNALPASVPEPATLVLLLPALAAITRRRTKRMHKKP